MRGKHKGAFSPGRAEEGDGGDDSSRWLGTYGDAITLLMAFFVMLYAMSEVDAQKFEAFVRGLQDPFNNSASSEGILEGAAGIVGEGGAPIPQDVLSELHSSLPAQAIPLPSDAQSEQEVEEEREAEPTAPQSDLPPTDDMAQLEAVQSAVNESLLAAGLDDLASFRFDGRGLVLSLATDDVLFSSGSTVISPLGQDLVAAVAGPIRNFGNDILVEGHTDDVPLNRAGYTNWNLSTDRAVAVLSLLAQQHEISSQRLGAAGFAEFRPRDTNDTSDGRANNRRVDILVVAEGVKIDG